MTHADHAFGRGEGRVTEVPSAATPRRQNLDETEMQELFALRWHWDSAYNIKWDYLAGEFTADRTSEEGEPPPPPADTLKAPDCETMRKLIHADYAAWKDGLPESRVDESSHT